MISVENALQIILNASTNVGVEKIPFLHAMGRVLQEDIVADRDFPPFNRVTMDGIAINYKTFKKGQQKFNIAGIQAAGAIPMTLQDDSQCIEVMTGAVLPYNTDTVIRYEDIHIEKGVATLLIDEIKQHQHIHFQGKDIALGNILISKNTVLGASEMGVLATVGKSKVKVSRLPKVMIISTGDELVAVDKVPKAHQIRRSNVFTIMSLLEKLKIPSEEAHLTDNKEVLKKNIKTFLEAYDVLLFSGAVSKGKYDFLPAILEELGVAKKFHSVSQRPGKPFWFGATQTCTIFAFPGNPVSTFVNCLVYFYPWYYKSVGVILPVETAILNEDVLFNPSLTYFLQVRLTHQFGKLIATPISGNGSGDLASLINADGFIVLPTEPSVFKKGASFKVIRYRHN